MDPGPNGSARRRQCRARIEITTNVATGESRILQRLRLYAISHSLFPPTTLRAAIHRLGFVQADPIRSPARAQDLILRHRVQDYRAGDLEQRYRTLKIEEDYLYAYGFVPRAVWRLIHPRDTHDLSPLEKKVLAVISKFGKMHPRELEAHFGRKRVVNAWGGYSKETTHALDRLHYRGLLRIAGREHGIRIYEPTTFTITSLSPVRRLRRLILVHASILAPVLENTLQSNISRYRRIGNPREILATLIRTGELEKEIADGLTYLWPAAKGSPEDELRSVRFLAPFDPLVWDRRRFEHLWRWPYRFEAYTPPAKRIRGYYAMPMLWRDHFIGWANARVADGRLDVDVGFVASRPRENDFSLELDAEIARLEVFLNSREAAV